MSRTRRGVACRRCGRRISNGQYSIVAGTLVCPDCAKQAGHIIPIGAST